MSSADDEKLLASRLAAVEAIPLPAAERVAREVVGAGPAIRASAMAWARSGQFPLTPVIHGYHAQRIARVFPRPSQVFNALVVLRREPVAALLCLRHAESAGDERTGR